MKLYSLEGKFTFVHSQVEKIYVLDKLYSETKLKAKYGHSMKSMHNK